jgi:MoaA/NifB/PqqE/SkfB family radical SAM enzyme
MNSKQTPEHDWLGPLPRSEELVDVALDLEVTSVCDAVCTFCPREFMPDKKTFISMEVIKRLAEDIQNRPGFPITLCGIGESLLHPQLNLIVQTLVDAGSKVEMTTNGGRMNVERFEELATLGMEGIHFSLNAATATTHAAVMKMKNFEKIVANLERILEVKNRSYPYTQVHVSFVVCDLNKHEVDDFVAFWKPKKPSAIWLHPLNNRAGLLATTVTGPANIAEIKNRYAADSNILVDVFGDVEEKDNVCKIARSMMFMSMEGEMRLCAMDYKRMTSFGNVKDKRLHAMHADKLMQYTRGEQKGFCGTCDFCPAAMRVQKAAAHV